MVQVHQLSAEEAKFERAKAERANFIVSEAISDPELMPNALPGIEACERGVSMFWPEFLRWEITQRGESSSSHQETDLKTGFELRVAPRARDLITNLDPDDRALFEDDLAALATNPYVDNVIKFSVPYPPLVLCLYQDGPFRIVYRIVGGSVIELLNVSEAPNVPPISEWDSWRRV